MEDSDYLYKDQYKNLSGNVNVKIENAKEALDLLSVMGGPNLSFRSEIKEFFLVTIPQFFQNLGDKILDQAANTTHGKMNDVEESLNKLKFDGEIMSNLLRSDIERYNKNIDLFVSNLKGGPEQLKIIDFSINKFLNQMLDDASRIAHRMNENKKFLNNCKDNVRNLIFDKQKNPPNSDYDLELLGLIKMLKEAKTVEAVDAIAKKVEDMKPKTP